MKPTRRQLIKTFAGIYAGATGVGKAAEASRSDIINRHQKQGKFRHNNMKRNAYVTIPAFCTKYFCANLHDLMSKRPRPIVYMDSHDYQRLWGQIVLERERSMQMIGMILESLRRRGFLRTIDYGEFYPVAKQEDNIERCRGALEGLPGHQQQQVAQAASKGFIDHVQQLEYQKSFRKALDNWEHAKYRKKGSESSLRRLERGRGTPVNRGERISAQYLAALEVRRALDQQTGSDLNVDRVIGQGESPSLAMLLEESSWQVDEEVANVSDGEIDQMKQFDPATSGFQREILDEIAQVAREATRTQHNDWFLLGSRLAAPHFPKLFMESWSQPAFNGGDKDTSEIAAETKEILARVERRTQGEQPVHLDNDAEAIAEQYGISSPDQVDEISAQLDRAADLSQAAPELREIADEDFEAASIMTAASVIMDPKFRYDVDQLYHRAWDTKQRYDPVEVPNHIVKRYSKRGGIGERKRKESPDWYQSFNRGRVRV